MTARTPTAPAPTAARARASKASSPLAAPVRTSVYVHFPWCLAKCPYCDFASGAIRRDEVPHDAYADAVLAELRDRRRALGRRSLVSVFFGGGTPSLWAAEAVARVVRGVVDAFGDHDPDLEVTLEANPTSLDEHHVAALRRAGVNRLSIGVQSLADAELRYLGRLHTADGALASLRAAKPMPRLSGDLMFGLPGVRASAFRDQAAALLELGLRHLSVYALTIEPGTQFGALHRKGRLPVASDEAFAETYRATEAFLASRGLGHYEVSSYAAPGEECRHNLHYWRGGDYLGLGAGAVGCLSTGAEARRYRNDPRPEAYLAQPGREAFAEPLGPEDRVREALMLGLRTSRGVDLADLRERLGVDPTAGRDRALARRHDGGDLVHEGDRLRVPTERWLHLDGIVADLF
ncbi:MAG: radical SAM family heme chaperone HemW [Sandaracinaceae bacterium]